jgi:hypothetical protein
MDVNGCVCHFSHENLIDDPIDQSRDGPVADTHTEYAPVSGSIRGISRLVEAVYVRAATLNSIMHDRLREPVDAGAYSTLHKLQFAL